MYKTEAFQGNQQINNIVSLIADLNEKEQPGMDCFIFGLSTLHTQCDLGIWDKEFQKQSRPRNLPPRESSPRFIQTNAWGLWVDRI